MTRYKSVMQQEDGYGNSSPWLDFIDPSRPGVVAGHAERTGLTGPTYPERAVYKLVLSGEKQLDGLFVYENGEFVPRDEWWNSTGTVLCHVLAGLREMGVEGA